MNVWIAVATRESSARRGGRVVLAVTQPERGCLLHALRNISDERSDTVVDSLNWGYVQLGLVTLAFGGLQIWWISSTLRGRRLARPMNEQEFRRSLETIWARDQQS